MSLDARPDCLNQMAAMSRDHGDLGDPVTRS